MALTVLISETLLMTAAEHPLPTPGTVKQLYGTAFRCARPDCKRPLYKLNDETGDRVLNSRVAHIHARRKGGPRWREMDAEENRSYDNLVLLCIEHSYEVDEKEALFPAEDLRAWKAAQIAEYDKIQRNWVLTEDEAVQVIVASDRYDSLHGPSTIELVRRVEAVRLVAERTRQQPRHLARQWQLLRDRTRASLFGYDEDGNRLFAEPSHADVRVITDAIVEALNVAHNEMIPAVEGALTELAAVKVTKPTISPWSDAVSEAIVSVHERSSEWTSQYDASADGDFDEAIRDMLTATDALVKASKDEPVEIPRLRTSETAAAAEEEPSALAAHDDLLEEARPFQRVQHRPYDAALRERVASAAEFAAGLPASISFMERGLRATAYLAVAVSRNATVEEKRALVAADRERSICASAALLHEHTQLRREGEESICTLATEELRHLWAETDWNAIDVWTACAVSGRHVLNIFAYATSDEEVRFRLRDALTENAELLVPIVRASASWGEQHSRQGGDLIGLTRAHKDLCPWLPLAEIRAIASSVRSAAAPDDDLEMLNLILGGDQR